jgi:hypothetical protein
VADAVTGGVPPEVPEAATPRSLKIGVLTFHRCINYGSYWQARALVEGLRARGHDAELLDHDCAQVRYAELRCAFQPLLPQRSPRSDFPHYAEKARRVLAAADALPLSPRFPLDRPDVLDGYDAIVVGSDEVWNMHHPWYGGKAIFYGDGLPAERLVSYAASFGNHDASEGLHHWWADKLRRFSAISVRDGNSRAMLRNSLDTEPDVVLDPVLQFPPNKPPEPAREDEAKPYVAVYGHSFPAWYSEAVRAFARHRGFRLVSIGYRNDWADEQRIGAGPLEFARLIANAASVATNFFHGCVFALLNSRPFACVASAYRSNKLRDLVGAVGAERRLMSGPEEIAGQLATPLSPMVAARIASLRQGSNRYLAHALG